MPASSLPGLAERQPVGGHLGRHCQPACSRAFPLPSLEDLFGYHLPTVTTYTLEKAGLDRAGPSLHLSCCLGRDVITLLPTLPYPPLIAYLVTLFD